MRFTPAGKYGGRENRLSSRETRCMSSHPCRAHHKLKWARKGQSILGVLYEHLPRSESNNTISTPKFSRNPAQKLLLKGEGNYLSGGGGRSPSRAHFKLSSLGRLRCQLPFQLSLLTARQHSQPSTIFQFRIIQNSTMKIKNPICAQNSRTDWIFAHLIAAQSAKSFPCIRRPANPHCAAFRPHFTYAIRFT